MYLVFNGPRWAMWWLLICYTLLIHFNISRSFLRCRNDDHNVGAKMSNVDWIWLTVSKASDCVRSARENRRPFKTVKIAIRCRTFYTRRQTHTHTHTSSNTDKYTRKICMSTRMLWWKRYLAPWMLESCLRISNRALRTHPFNRHRPRPAAVSARRLRFIDGLFRRWLSTTRGFIIVWI